MKKILLFSASVVAASMMWAQNHKVTLQVDMSKEVVDPAGVFLAGSLQSEASGGTVNDWTAGDAAFKLTAGTAGVYSIDVNIPDGNYNYKFVNGTGGWESGSDRPVTVAGADVVVPVYCFNEKTTAGPCPAGIPDTLNVTLKVNMRNFIKKYGAVFTSISVAGDFQKKAGAASAQPTWGDWTPGQINLTDANTDSVYEVSFRLPEGKYSFKYVAGDAWGKDELVPSGCAVGGNREMIISGNPNDNQLVGPFCFGECADCSNLGPQRLVSFRVDMTAEVYSADSVFVGGSMKYPTDTKTKMMQVGASDIFETTMPVYTGSEYGYKFFNNAKGESVGLPCGLDDFGKNRKLTLSIAAPDTTLPVYVYGSCNTSANGSSSITRGEAIGFRVFPNPFSSSARIEFNNSDRYTVEVLTLAGQIVERMEVANSYAEINRKQLSAGMYLISVSNAAGVRTTQKLVIE